MATNQDRINEIYNSSDDPWSTHGDELNALVKNRDAEYTGGGGNSNNSNTAGSVEALSNTITGGIDTFITGIKDGVTEIGSNIWSWATSGGVKDSTATYDEWGNQLTGETGSTTQTNLGINDFTKMAVLSIVDPEAAALKNPYWNQETGTYDKHRDVNNDGFPDYDSAGRPITYDPSFSHQKGQDISSGEFKIGHTTYQYNSSSGGWEKMKADGTVDNGTDDKSHLNENGNSEFDQMIEDTQVELKTQMELYKEEAEKILTDKTDADIKAIIDDPEAWLTSADLSVSNKIDNLEISDEDIANATINPENPNYQIDTEGLDAAVKTVDTDNLELVDQITAKNADTYDANLVTDKITGEKYEVDPITGEVSDKSLVDSNDIIHDIEGASTGVNEDGSKNYVGEALNDYANQNISNIIDTSTVAGKLLAQELGEGNYTDSKATMMGQLEIISKQFVDADGNPKIPTWASALTRSVSRNVAFTGVSGTAAMSAMSSALLESTLPIAEKDSAFFQTLTTQNLSNRQESIINKAKVLSNLEMQNVDVKTQASIHNAEAFLKMDLTNLEIQNEAEIINTQHRVQGLFEDQKAINTQRMFTAEQTNDMNKFYDNLSTQVEMFVAEQVNGMKKFNVGEINDNAEFNATLQNNREQFLADMQFNIDTAIAEWKQNVILTEYKTKADAASEDVKNMLGVKLEVMNQLWDEADMLLDYVIKLGEAEKDREIMLAEIAAGNKASKNSIWGQIWGAATTVATKWALGI